MTSRNGSAHPGNRPSDEETPLLGKPTGGRQLGKRFRMHMTLPITKNWADSVLLLCYVITGLLDSSSTKIWNAFVSMQTGNTVYVSLGLVDPGSSNRWIKSLTSITFFCLGSFCFAAFHRQFSPRLRWVVVASFTFQLLCIVFAALIVTFGKNSADDIHWQVLVPLAALAFQSSGQAVNSRVFEHGGLTSVVLTSIYCDLFSDQELFTGLRQNVQRNRRIGAPLLLVFGAMMGGLWSKSDVGLAGALWSAAALKLAIVIAWLVWSPEADQAEE